MAASFSIVRYHNPVLRKKAKEIKTVTDEHRQMLRNMAQVMRENQGIGLAAPQIGLSLRLVVVDTGRGLLKFINPVINEKNGNDTMDEGCLSVPSALVTVKRSKTVTVEYTDEWGKPNKKTFDGLTAKAIQHEIDHLNGRLILDYLPWYRKMLFKKY